MDDDATGSALWLPLWEAIDRSDSIYRRSAKTIERGDRLALAIAQLVGPEANEVLEWLRRAPLHEGVAAERVDADGKAISHGGDATLSALLAYVTWYAVQAYGVQPRP
jgi:hypothetical protein